MNRSFRAACGLIALSGLVLSACMDQYHPEPYWAQFKQEREVSNRKVVRLTATGELPSGTEEAVPIAQIYKNYCENCHGAAGAGDGPGGAALTPKPRNFVDASWQAATDDARIAKVIKEGGASVGLSPMMAPWGSVMKDDDIKRMVEFIRGMKK